MASNSIETEKIWQTVETGILMPEESQLSFLKTLVTRFTRLPGQRATFHAVVSAMHALCDAIDQCYSAGQNRDRIMQALQPAIEICSGSPFVRRLQTWPRGYPGDFETVEYIMAQANLAPPGTVAFHVEQYSLASAIAQQHRNKIRRQAELIQEAALESPTARILIFGCGGAPDVRQVSSLLKGRQCRLILNDIDEDALTFCKKKLDSIQSQCHFVKGNALTSLAKVARHGPFDVILCGGLFDYFSDRQIRFLLTKSIDGLMAQGGSFFFTNIIKGHQYRTLIEHFGNWRLIERSDQDLKRLLATIPVDKVETKISKDGTSLCHLVELKLRSPHCAA